MLWFLVSLTTLSALLLLIGFVWILVENVRAVQRRDQDVGKEALTGKQGVDVGYPPEKRDPLGGQAVSTQTRSNISFADVKAQIRIGQWREVLPLLAAITGFLGLMLFGSLAFFVALENKLFGALVALASISATLRVVIGLIRV